MITHPALSILLIAHQADTTADAFCAYLTSIQGIALTRTDALPDDVSGFSAILGADASVVRQKEAELKHYAQAGGVVLLLVNGSDQPLPELFGVRSRPPGPLAEVRVLFDKSDHPLADRLPDAIYITGCFQPLEPATAEVETILYADWHYQHKPMLTVRPFGSGFAACTTLAVNEHPVLHQILYRLIRNFTGQSSSQRSLGVGILGYAPSVGQLHGMGADATTGMKLHAVCDLNPERLTQATKDFSGVFTYSHAELMADDPDIDLVIIATAPNTHATLACQMMAAGKHVICEKPLALSRSETDAMAADSEKYRVHLSCHQNRRWDVDYLAIKQAITQGLIGDLFYMETFVGGYHHPCGYWHSHAEVSGGTTFDWGGHYLDWIVSLVADRTAAIVCTRQNRVWHDVTNADQERIQIRFQGGQEAEFMHSDIAGTRKPKWYLLGTSGAIIGNWHDITTYQIDPVLYFHEHAIPATEMPPQLTLYRRETSGQMVPRSLAMPERQDFGFHRNIADHLLTGEPLVAPLSDSIRVVAILEAAAKSAANGGTVEVLHV